jgi:hypothetical protein
MSAMRLNRGSSLVLRFIIVVCVPYYCINNMEAIIALVFIATVLFILVKIIEMKYVQKEFKPLKELVRDAVYVAVCTGISSATVFTMHKSLGGFFGAITEQSTLPQAAPVFTDNPGF